MVHARCDDKGIDNLRAVPEIQRTAIWLRKERLESDLDLDGARNRVHHALCRVHW